MIPVIKNRKGNYKVKSESRDNNDSNTGITDILFCNTTT